MMADPDRDVAVGGAGPHSCPGPHLARVDLGAPGRGLLTRLPDLAPARPVASVPSTSTSGPKPMPVQSSPQPRSTP